MTDIAQFSIGDDVAHIPRDDGGIDYGFGVVLKRWTFVPDPHTREGPAYLVQFHKWSKPVIVRAARLRKVE